VVLVYCSGFLRQTVMREPFTEWRVLDLFVFLCLRGLYPIGSSTFPSLSFMGVFHLITGGAILCTLSGNYRLPCLTMRLRPTCYAFTSFCCAIAVRNRCANSTHSLCSGVFERRIRELFIIFFQHYLHKWHALLCRSNTCFKAKMLLNIFPSQIVYKPVHKNNPVAL
jgi:hypothetical protein